MMLAAVMLEALLRSTFLAPLPALQKYHATGVPLKKTTWPWGRGGAGGWLKGSWNARGVGACFCRPCLGQPGLLQVRAMKQDLVEGAHRVRQVHRLVRRARAGHAPQQLVDGGAQAVVVVQVLRQAGGRGLPGSARARPPAGCGRLLQSGCWVHRRQAEPTSRARCSAEPAASLAPCELSSSCSALLLSSSLPKALATMPESPMSWSRGSPSHLEAPGSDHALRDLAHLNLMPLAAAAPWSR
jgi:hypothetical protein